MRQKYCIFHKKCVNNTSNSLNNETKFNLIFVCLITTLESSFYCSLVL